MRPLKVVMTAFGPYKGKEVIDFNEIKHDQLFLITGPTGAGKTTIFDAISYALYGQTSGDYRPENTVRCQNAEEDMLTEVELHFELKGKEYYVKRQPRQQAKKKRGEGYRDLPPKAEFYRVGDEKIVTGSKEVSAHLTDLLGLEVDQFRQIMMIPQGEFRKLLMADSSERTKILKSLFDTSLFSNIQANIEKESKAIKDKIAWQLKERDQLFSTVQVPESVDDADVKEGIIQGEDKNPSVILSIIDQIMALDQDTMKALKEDHGKLRKEEVALVEKKSKAESRNQLVKELQHYEEQAEALKAKKEDIEGLKHRKVWIEKAKDLQPLVDKVENYKEQIDRLDHKINHWLDEKTSTEAGIKIAKEKADYYSSNEGSRYRKKLEEERVGYEQWIPNLSEAVRLKGVLDSLVKEVANLKQAHKENEEEEKSFKEEVKKINEQLAATKDHSERLIRAKLSLEQEETTIQQARNLLVRIRNYLDLLKKETSMKASLEKEHRKVEDLEVAYLEVQRDYHLNQAAILAVALKDGQACPVCGSKDHVQKAVFTGEPMTKDQVDGYQQSLEKARQDYNKLTLTLKGLSANVANEGTEINHTMNALAIAVIDHDLEKSVIVDGKQRSKVIEGLNQEIQTLKASTDQRTVLENRMAFINKALEERFEMARENQERLHALSTEEARVKASMDMLLKGIPEELQEYTKLQQRLDQVNRKISDFDSGKDQAQEVLKEYSEKLASVTTSIEEVKIQHAEANEMMKIDASKLQDALLEAEFENIEQVRSYSMMIGELSAITTSITSYDQEVHTVNEQLGLLKEKTTGLSMVDLSTFDVALEELKVKEASLSNAISQLDKRIDHHAKVVERVNHLSSLMKEDEERFKVIGHVANMINGNNTRKLTLERYVLSSYLRDILQVANHRLRKMTNNRYALKIADGVEDRRKGSGLDLAVDDSYTGLSRSVKTLSGGESFKASLAMALALAEVVQSHAGGIQLDTVFIDEGFGTLDQESLDQAINCLIELQDAGRLVGIISHVRELKERIGTQLVIDVEDETSTTRFKHA